MCGTEAVVSVLRLGIRANELATLIGAVL